LKTPATLLSFCRYALLHPKVKRAAWAACLLLALDLLVLALFWGPIAFQHYRLEKGIRDYRRAEREARQAQENSRQYEQLVKRAGSLEAKWETPVTQAQLIESLTRLSSKNGLKVISQDFDVAPARGGGQSFRQNLALVGGYTSLRRFLTGLESLPSLTVVEEARLEREGEGLSGVRASLQLSTFTKSPGKGD
jgi:Tfp pilus assembly protein PilO